LFFNTSVNQRLGLWVQWYLTGKKHERTGLDSLGIRANSSWGSIGMYGSDVRHDALC